MSRGVATSRAHRPVPRRGAAVSAGGSPCKLICVHTRTDPQGARPAPLLRGPPLLYSPFRSISYIYLRISLFYERPALFASLNYRKHVLPVITPVDRPISRCRMHMRWICVVYRWCRQRSDRPPLNDLSDVT